MKRSLLCLLLLAVSLSFAHPSSAFDGKRKGFLLGGGLGLGAHSFTQSINDIEGDRESKGALVTNFKIGGGFSEQFLLYYNAHQSWFTLLNILDDDITIASGVSGLGFTWFTNPEPRGLFLTGTLGIATWDAPFESGSSTWTSFGVIAGIGYEFSPHWAVDLSLMLGSPEKTEGGITAKTDFFGVAVTVTGLAY